MTVHEQALKLWEAGARPKGIMYHRGLLVFYRESAPGTAKRSRTLLHYPDTDALAILEAAALDDLVWADTFPAVALDRDTLEWVVAIRLRGAVLEFTGESRAEALAKAIMEVRKR